MNWLNDRYRSVIASAFLLVAVTAHSAYAADPTPTHRLGAPKLHPLSAAVVQYAEGLAGGDRGMLSRLDFACLFRLRSESKKAVKALPAADDPYYQQCWDDLAKAHVTAVDRPGRGMDALWPGPGSLVFFEQELRHYAPSFFVMPQIGQSPPGSGLRVEAVSRKAMTPASFSLRSGQPVVAVPAWLVRTRVTYRDLLTAPVSYASGSYKWTNTIKRPRAALKSVMVRWVVLTGLKKFGFPRDVAVVNRLVGGDRETPVPFLTETVGADTDSAQWWQPEDAPGTLVAGVGRAVLLPDLHDRVALLNRVLIVDPAHPEALTALSRDLYQTILDGGTAARPVAVRDFTLSNRLSEFYWDTYAQTARTDLSLGMEMGGYAEPTAADFLYRMIPAMERLAQVRPEDFENRIRLGVAYRWNNDQDAAIVTHEQLLKDLPPERAAVRARVLVELAWSRIAKVAWNRNFDDPNLEQAYRDAQQAASIADRPMDKFASAYTLAYSRIFMPERDNQKMLAHLTEARRWFDKLPGTSPQAWRYLLGNETMKAVLDADPSFKPLLATTEQKAS